MKHIYLVRHGHTEDSQLVCYRENQVPLSGEGMKQADRLEEYFRDKNISAVYSSPYKRALQTAELMMPGRDIGQENNFREIDMGIWQGRTFKEIKSLWPEDYEERGRKPLDFRAPEGESFRNCLKRAKEALLEICSRTEGDLVVVSHSGVIKALLWDLLEKQEEEFFAIKQDFAAVNILEYDEKTKKLTAAEVNLSV